MFICISYMYMTHHGLQAHHAGQQGLRLVVLCVVCYMYICISYMYYMY
jgi:hypothetical protein